jgi:RND family efflux transporter MFP subunit
LTVFSRSIIGAAIVPLIVSSFACSPTPEAAAAEVDTTVASADSLVRSARSETIVAAGTVGPRASAELAFRVPGTVMAVGYEEGDQVRAGELVAYLDPTDYALAFEQAKIGYQVAEADARRARVLRATDANIDPNDYNAVMSAEAILKLTAIRAEKRLYDTRLVTPLGGVVARRVATPGEIVNAGSSVFTIVDVDVVHVTVMVSEEDVGSITKGSSATVTVPALPGAPFEGRVRVVGVKADSTSGAFPVEIAVPNPGHRIRVGMAATAVLRRTAKAQVLEPVVISAVAPSSEREEGQ